MPLLAWIVNLLFRCKHDNLSRPITPVTLPEQGAATYVVCLDCGRRFAYDWKEMRVGHPVETPAGDQPSRV